ncbi:tyrosine-type recombinase/integrase [Tuwongella immobilis]|uniref:Tyr recombinase domain-containing protein n=1 Tax=Tuwongella immobilis TaxID=692036 RepID=A0A6C2YQW2_9BACT|nr:tyrosine-type recombinase/integrase [Tuwongella immobilis]VIP03747.1 catalytic phage domain protein : Integrase, catalytic core, phage domain protein OS=Rhodopirellula sallentina SM41 GN=RSSM_06627 PE=4 SV=1: Phage_integrase [Tuwongella immobilis]VTS04862.1 catalytic phage domain protein : Integrase, catalytic core, phage domain protein OS=Rhodopirellula sallentina SM41 GN=RSSM_06627 PE=4 SV=1: Phage_integrase [Tuwongella immobilis]
MPRVKNSLPAILRHKDNQLGYINLSGELHYLGYWPPEMARPPLSIVEKADSLIAEWISLGRRPLSNARGTGRTINEIIVAFFKHGESYYRHADQTPTGELENFRYGLRDLHEKHGHRGVSEFTIEDLRNLRADLIERRLARTTINANIRRIRTVFRWAASEGLIDAEIPARLAVLQNLKANRSSAKETMGICGVQDEQIEAILPHLTPTLRSMVLVQRLTGMRPGELVNLRVEEIERSQEIWQYRPSKHKTSHRGSERIVLIGPKAQAILGPLLSRSESGFIFQVAESLKQHRNKRREQAKTKYLYSKSKEYNSTRQPVSKPYSRQNYSQAIARACKKAGIPVWSANRLRHTFATEGRKIAGIEAVRQALGHTTTATTEIYAKSPIDAAIELAKLIG